MSRLDSEALLRRDGPLEARADGLGDRAIASALSAAHDLDSSTGSQAGERLDRRRRPGPTVHPTSISRTRSRERQASNVRRTGMFLGTAGYASPDRSKEGVSTRGPDIYSLGCVLECPNRKLGLREGLGGRAGVLRPPPRARHHPQRGPTRVGSRDRYRPRARHGEKADDRYDSAKEMAAAVRELSLHPRRPSQASSRASGCCSTARARDGPGAHRRHRTAGPCGRGPAARPPPPPPRSSGEARHRRRSPRRPRIQRGVPGDAASR